MTEEMAWMLAGIHPSGWIKSAEETALLILEASQEDEEIEQRFITIYQELAEDNIARSWMKCISVLRTYWSTKGGKNVS